MTRNSLGSTIEKAAWQIPDSEFSILLSHTPEVYRQVAHANFNLMLNERPRKTLSFETPAKRFNTCVASTG
jgi:hypothetical protein